LAFDHTTDTTLIHRCRAGDEDAAASLFLRYAQRLRQIAHLRCSRRHDSRYDADDIVQSVFRTFFQGVRRRAYEVPPGGTIWRLLMVLAVNKVRNHAAFHRAAKRDVAATQSAADAELRQALATDESAVTLLRMVLDEQLAGLPAANRQIIRLRIEGYDVGEIATRAGRSRRTVERVLQEFRTRLTKVL